MSHIEDLTEELCPNGVEYRQLGTLGRRNKGMYITAARMKELASQEGTVRVFAGGQTYADVHVEALPSESIVRDESIIVRSRGNIGFTHYDKPFTHKSELWSYTIDASDVSQKFVFYFLEGQVARLQELARAKSVKLPQLAVGDTDSLLVPVPPLEVQQEVVRILDKLTALEVELEVELEAELTARWKQYNHLAHLVFKSLTAGHKPTVPLSDLGRWVGGRTPSKLRPEYWDHEGLSWISPKDMTSTRVCSSEDHVSATAVAEGVVNQLPAGSVAIVVRSSILQHTLPVALVGVPSCINQDLKALLPSDRVESRYVVYALQSLSSEVLHQVRRTGGSVSSLDSKKLANFEIPVPPLDEQRRIADILDKFDALVNDLSVGLPAELAARRKQYEYYRDRLLTFKELAA